MQNQNLFSLHQRVRNSKFSPIKWPNKSSLFAFPLLLLFCLLFSPTAFSQCNCTDNIYIGNTSITQEGLSSGDWNNECILIDGVFVIDEDFTVNVGDFQMADGASIEIAEGITFTVTGSMFDACEVDGQWNGISLLTDAYLNIESSEVHHAIEAISATTPVSACTLRVISNIFFNNLADINIASNAMNLNLNLNTGIEENLFTRDDFMLTNPVGINFTNVTLSGTQSIDDNRFISKTDGVRFEGCISAVSYENNIFRCNTAMTFTDCQSRDVFRSNTFEFCAFGMVFQDCSSFGEDPLIRIDPDNHFGPIRVHAIQISNCTAPINILRNNFEIIGDTGILMADNDSLIHIRDNNFHNMIFGVRGNDTEAEVIRDTLSLIRNTAVLMADGQDHNLIVNQNTISEMREGITVREYDTGDVLIQGNKISQDSASIAIYLIDNISTTLLNNNDINVFNIYAWYGVFIHGSENVLIFDTEVYQHGLLPVENPPNPQSGYDAFYLTESSSCQMVDNEFNRNAYGWPIPPHETSRTGFLIQNSFNNLFCCNEVDDCRRGFHIRGAANDTRLRSTIFGDGALKDSVGIFDFDVALLVDNTMIGTQDNHANSWANTNAEFAEARIDASAAQVAGSQFFANPLLIPNGYANIENTAGNPQDWFIWDGNALPDCSFELGTGSKEFCSEDPFGRERSKASVAYLSEFDIYYAQTKTSKNPIEEATNWRGKQYLYKKLKQNTSLLGQDKKVDLFYNDTQNRTMALLEDIDSGIKAIKLIIPTDQASKLQKYQLADQLLALNETINTSEIYEENEQVINSIYLNTIAKDIFDFTTHQKEIISSIAEQCALAGGKGVITARILESRYKRVRHDDEYLCNSKTEDQRHEEVSNSIPANEFKIYPNPTYDNEFNISLNQVFDQDSEVQILDISGKVITVKQLPAGHSNYTIKLEKLQSGTYFVQFTDPVTKNIFVEKLIVIQ